MLVRNRQPKLTAFCSHEKSYTSREDLPAKFLNAFNTDFEKKNTDFELIRYSPQLAASTFENRQYCTTLNIKHMHKHGDDVIRP